MEKIYFIQSALIALEGIHIDTFARELLVYSLKVPNFLFLLT